MNECIEKTGRWPEEPADVSPDELDAFLNHARDCNFHAEKLRTEEEELRSMFRRARGLDSHGRILRGREMKKAIEEHERRYALWQADARRVRPPLKRIYLSNRGVDLSGSGEFSYFRGYESGHPSLDPQAGLQIWGVIGEGKTEEVLLGFYPLAGIRHTGKEKFFPLDNGYTIGLRVEQLAERHFKLGFRCVENEVLEQEQAEALNQKGKVRKMAAAAGDLLLTHVQEFFSLQPLWRRRTAVATASILALAVVVGVVHRRMSEDLLKVVPTTNSNLSGHLCIAKDTSLSATGEGPTIDIVRVSDSQKNPASGSRQSAMKDRKEIKQPRAVSTTAPEAATAKSNGPLTWADASQIEPVPGSESSDRTEVSDSKDHGSQWYLQSSLNGKTAANIGVIVHIGNDEILRDKLFAAIHQRDIDVVPMDAKATCVSTTPQATVTWSITRQDKAVTVKLTVTADGETKLLSFRSEGTCEEQACERAVNDAVSSVFAILRGPSTTVAAKS